MKISDCESLTWESATLKGFHVLPYSLLWWTLHFWDRWLSPRWFFFIEKKETDIEIIVGSHSSSPCYLSPTSSWESATQFLGTTGNKSTDHLKWSTKIARIWPSSCERVPFFKANITKKFYLLFGASLVSHSLSGIYLARLRFPFCNRPHVGWVIALVKCLFIILVLLFMHQNGKMGRNQAAEKFFQERRGFPPGPPQLAALSLPPAGSPCFLVLCPLTQSPTWTDQASGSSWT